MPASLYDVSVGSYLQTFDALAGVLDKAAAHFRETAVDPLAIVDTRLYADMWPFGFQVQHAAFHATASIAAIRSGRMSPFGPRARRDHAGLQALIAETRTSLRAVTREEIDAREGSDIVLVTKASTRVFTAAGFILTFSLPNVHFHVAIAYAILRQAGVPVGKRDFIGEVRTKEAPAETTS